MAEPNEVRLKDIGSKAPTKQKLRRILSEKYRLPDEKRSHCVTITCLLSLCSDPAVWCLSRSAVHHEYAFIGRGAADLFDYIEGS
jgi:hypothetical protein